MSTKDTPTVVEDKNTHQEPSSSDTSQTVPTTKSYSEQELQEILKKQYDLGKMDKGREYKLEQEKLEKEKEEEEAKKRGEYDKLLEERENQIKALEESLNQSKEVLETYAQRERRELEELIEKLPESDKGTVKDTIDGLDTEKAMKVVKLAMGKKPITTPGVQQVSQSDKKSEWNAKFLKHKY